MAFEWLDRFQREAEKAPRHAEKALAAYRLGKKSGGALAGVVVRGGAGCCRAAARLEQEAPRDPVEAPVLPLPECDRPGACRCGYRPVMTYEVAAVSGTAAGDGAARSLGAAPRLAQGGASDGPAPAGRVVVVGADGFVGGGLARALGAARVVYREPSAGEVHVSRSSALLGAADVVVTAHGFRVRPGCGYEEYRRSHEQATAAVLPALRRGALLLHVSSASVLGTGVGLGNRAVPNPTTFPSPAYATAKLEEDRYVARAAAERGLRAILLRPAVLYAPGGSGMVETLLKLARRGVTLRLYPRDARHHLCHMDLLADVARRVMARPELPTLTALVVADPYTVTNAELEAMTAPARRRASVTVPLPLSWVSALLRRAPASKSPTLDLRTRGEIFGVLHMDTVYDPSDTFALLGIDPAEYSLEKTLRPVIAEALAS
jgi:nucleoside-diphosphate-sugar epimerase